MNDLAVPDALWALPTCPQIAHQILKRRPLGKSSVLDLLGILRWDPALSIRILAAANDTKAGRSQPVASLPKARRILGDFTIRLLSLQFTLESLLPENEAYRNYYETYWRQCRVHAITTELLAANGTEDTEVDPFLLGLFLCLDRLALLQANSQRFGIIHTAVIQTASAWSEIQRETHSSRDPHPLLLANFPQSITNAVKAKSTSSSSPWNKRFAIAQAMGDDLDFGGNYPALASKWRERLMMLYADYQKENPKLGCPLELLIDTVRNRLEESQRAEEPLPSPAHMLELANRELGQLGRRSHQARRRTNSRLRNAERTLHNLKREALRDPLTGVYNRRFLLEALHNEAARCQRHATPIGLLFVDVDEFKTLNDTWGHLVGDLVLKRVAKTLLGTLRQADVFARYGGEEFVILPMDPTESGLIQLAERLRRAVELLEIQAEGTPISITISVGATLIVPGPNDRDVAGLLLDSADKAMYEAKRLGRNRIVFLPRT